MPVTKETIEQFAQRIKTKYPDYKDIPDSELVNRIITKHPEYRDRVDIGGQQPAKQQQAPAPAPDQSMNPFRDLSYLQGPTAEEKHTELLSGAHERVLNELQNSQKAIGSLLTKQKMKEFQDKMDAYRRNDAKGERPIPDLTFTKQARDIQAAQLVPQALEDPDFQIKVLKEQAELHPEKSNQIKADIYTLNAHDRAHKTDKVKENAEKIAKGELDYNITRNQLIKPEGFIPALGTSYNNRIKARGEYDFFQSATQDQIRDKLEADYKSYDPDEPQNTPHGIGGHLGGMIGGQPPQALLAGAAVGMVPGAQEAAPWAAALAASPEIHAIGYVNSLHNNYSELRNQGLSPEDAAKKAQNRADVDANIDMAQGALMTAAGTRLGLNSPKINLTQNFVKAVATGTKEALKATTAEALPQGVIAAGLQGAKNLYSGKPIGEGMTETAAQTMAMVAGIGLLLKAPKAIMESPRLLNRIKTGLADNPDVVNEQLAQMVKSGDITEDQANDVHQQLQQHVEQESRIPATITDEGVREKLRNRFEKYDKLKAELETVHESMHPARKEQIKALEEEIAGLEKEGIEKSKEAEKAKVPLPSEQAKLLLDEGLDIPEGKKGHIGEEYEDFKDHPEQLMSFINDEIAKNRETEMRNEFGDGLVDLAKENNPHTSSYAGIRNVKPKENAIPIGSSVDLPENTNNGKQSTKQGDFSEGTQEKSGINSQTEGQSQREIQERDLSASIDWLDAIERNDTEKSRNSEKKLLGESILESSVLANNDRGGATVRAQGDNGEAFGTKAVVEGTRSSQERGYDRQSDRESGTSNSQPALETSQFSTQPPRGRKNVGFSEAERRSVVEKIQSLSDVSNRENQIRSARSLRELLSSNSTPEKQKAEIINLIKEKLNKNGTISQPSPSRMVQHPQEGVGEEGSGRERVEPIQQGEEPAGTRIGQPQENKSQGKESEVDPTYQLPFEMTAEDKRTGIKNQISNTVRFEMKLPKVEVPKLGSDTQILAEGKELVDSGKINPREVVDRILSTNEGMHPDEAKAMQYYMHQLGAHEEVLRQQLADAPDELVKAYTNQQMQQLSDEIDAATEANIKSGKAWSDVGNIRQIVVDPAFNASRERSLIKEAYGGKLPPGVQERLDKIMKERDAALEAKVKAEERLKNAAAEKTLQKVKEVVEKEKKANPNKKQSKEDILKERESLFEELKKAWKEDRSQLGALPLPTQTIGVIGKLAINYFKEGYVNLEELTSKVFEDIKAHAPGISKKQVRDAISQFDPLRDVAEQKGKEKLAAKEARINKKLATGDIVDKKKNPSLNFEKDTEWHQANQRAINAEYKLKEEKRKAFESQKNTYQKGLMWAGRMFRLSILSGYNVLGKLAAAATVGGAGKRIPEQAIGSIYSQIFKSIADKAPIEGNPNLMAELKFYKEFFDPKKFARNSWEILKTGASPLSKQFGSGEYEHIPGLYLPTDLHQIIKDPLKRGTFEASFRNAMSWADKNGLDITDPLVIQSMETAAYKRAQYEIFQEKNWLSEKFGKFKANMEKNGNVGATGKFLADFLIPVSTVPTNIARRLTTTSPLGLIRGSKMVIDAYRKGIENLSNEQADAVMKQLKQGSLGTALWLIGWFGASQFGGLYSKFNPNKKRNEGEFTSDQMAIGGEMIPKPVQHALPLEVIQLAATMKHIHDHYRQEGSSEFTTDYHAAMGAIGATLEQIPVLETLTHTVEATQDPYGAKKLAEDAKKRFVPQILKETGVVPKEEKKTEKSSGGSKKGGHKKEKRH